MSYKKYSTDKLQRVHEASMQEFIRAQSSQWDERMQAVGDRRFYSIAGAQWEGDLGEQFANKPKFEVNKAHLAVIRIINEYRNNRIDVKFLPKDGVDDGDGLADTCAGLYRADEQDSCAQEAYDNAFEEGVGGGFGAWRLIATKEDEYEDDDEDDRQRIRIEPIFDADSCVFFDEGAKRQDKSDSKRCWVLTGIPIQDYIDEWDDDPASWPKDVQNQCFDWCTPDLVYVAEYYEIELKKEIIQVWRTISGDEEMHNQSEFDKDEGLADYLQTIGSRHIRDKNVKRRRVHKYLMSGSKILEDCGYIPGKHIPIVPFYGKRWFVDGVERFMGHVRLCKDVCRLKNMQLSKLGEISALSSVQKPIVTPQQIAGHQIMWQNDNIKNYPYLLLNEIVDANGNSMPQPPIGYTQPAQIPPAMAALLQITEQDMQDILGNQQNAEEMQPNSSGVAIELIQNKIDMQSYIYMSNMAKAVKRCGQIWLSMASEIYVEDNRKMKVIGSQDEISSVELMRPTIDKSGKESYENDLSRARFDVAVETGPSSDSRRASVVRALTGIAAISDDPETRQVLISTALMNMDGEGLSETREYFRRKMIKIGAAKPTEEESAELQAEMANQAPDPNAQYLAAAAQQAEAEAAQARAKTVLTVSQASETEAKTDKLKAETMKTIADIDHNGMRLEMDALKDFKGLDETPATAQRDNMRE